MQITQGRVYSQRFYDIADEVDLVQAEVLLKERLPRSPTVRKSQHLRIPRPPLELTIAPPKAEMAGLTTGEVRLRIYNVGVLAITFELPFATPMSPEALVQLSAAVFEAESAITDAGRLMAEELAVAIKPACKDPKLSSLTEDYTVFAIEKTDGSTDAETIRRELDIPRVLLGELDAVSAQERAEVVERSFCYDPKELVVITWNSGLVVGRDSLATVLDLLEVAGMQLLELRHYDDEVHRSLDWLYDELEKEPTSFLWANRYRRLSRTIMRLFVDVTEVTERVDNSLQWLGDTFYARIHRAAVKAFDIPRWQSQLEHKLDLLQEINDLIVNQLTTRQSMRMELSIVLLIVFEIVMAFFKLM